MLFLSAFSSSQNGRSSFILGDLNIIHFEKDGGKKLSTLSLLALNSWVVVVVKPEHRSAPIVSAAAAVGQNFRGLIGKFVGTWRGVSCHSRRTNKARTYATPVTTTSSTSCKKPLIRSAPAVFAYIISLQVQFLSFFLAVPLGPLGVLYVATNDRRLGKYFF